MKATDQLKEVLQTEVDLVEALIEALEYQRQAIIYYNVDALNQGGKRQEELLKPFDELETERIKIVESVLEENSIEKSEDVRLTEIADKLPPAEGETIRSLGLRLRNACKKVLEINEENGKLIEYTQKFIHNNVKLLTENFSRQIVDAKM